MIAKRSALLVLALLVAGSPALAQEFICIKFDTTLESLSLTGGPFPMPLASDPGNALGDSVDGYGFVDSEVTISLSASPATVGEAFAFNEGEAQAMGYDLVAMAAERGLAQLQNGDRPAAGSSLGAGVACDGTDIVDPALYDGENFVVDSFFDVFFDITVTDVDNRPGRDFAGQPDGASFVLTDNGPAHMQSFTFVLFDADAPNFGLIPPPEADPYIGHFDIEIPLGGDINGNGENDKIKFQLATHSAGDQNRTFVTLPNGTVLDNFDSAAFLEGAVVDESADPPFTIGAQLPNGLPDPAAFGGPTEATSTLVNPLLAIPATNNRTLVLLTGLLLFSVAALTLRATLRRSVPARK